MDKFVFPVRTASVPTRYFALNNPQDRWAVYNQALGTAPTTVFRYPTGFPSSLVGANNAAGYIRPVQAPFYPGQCIDIKDDAGNYIASGTPLYLFATLAIGAREIPTVTTIWIATTDWDTTTLTWDNQPNTAGWIAKRLIDNSSDTHGNEWELGVQIPIERETFGFALTAEGDGPVGAIAEAQVFLSGLYLVCRPAL